MIKTKMLGLPELKGEIARLNAELERAEEPTALAAGEPIRERWAGLVPVDEGHYRDALIVGWDPDRRAAAVGVGWAHGADREDQPFLYAKRLEFGDEDLPARPSARPALAASRAAAKAAAEEPLRARIKGRRPRRMI